MVKFQWSWHNFILPFYTLSHRNHSLCLNTSQMGCHSSPFRTFTQVFSSISVSHENIFKDALKSECLPKMVTVCGPPMESASFTGEMSQGKVEAAKAAVECSIFCQHRCFISLYTHLGWLPPVEMFKRGKYFSAYQKCKGRGKPFTIFKQNDLFLQIDILEMHNISVPPL